MHPVSEAVRIRHLTSLSLCLFPGKLPDFIELMSFSGKVLTAVYNFSPYHCSADHNMRAGAI